MRSLVKKLFRRVLATPPRQTAKFRSRLAIESLEDRSVPSILFSSTGSRTIIDSGGPILRQTQVDLIFWGAHWDDPGANQTLRTNVQDTVNAILNSTYFDGLAQYRGIIRGSLLRSDTITSSSPGATFQTAQGGDLSTMVANNINNGTLPSPNGQILYFVVPQPGSTASDCNGCVGRHLAAFASGNRVFPYGVTNNPTGVSLNTLSVIMSHELAEAATNPEWNIPNQAAFHVPNSNGDEIGDGEAQNYTYRVYDAYNSSHSALVQSYLSQRDHAYVVTNGSTNNFLVSSTRVLTFQESSGGFNRIFLNLIGNGVYAELNNSTAQFEPGAISAIQVDSGTSNENQINIAGTPVPVTVIGSGTAGIGVGSNGQLTNILASVTVSGTNSTVTVDDSADRVARTVTLDTVVLGGVNYGRISFNGVPPIQYQYGSNVNATVHTGIGGAAVTVQANGVPTSLVGHGLNTTVTVGFAGRVINILGSVTVTNPPAHTAVTVDDSADTIARAITLDTVILGVATFGRISFGGVPVQFKRGDTDAALHTGIGGAAVAVRATAVATNVLGHGSLAVTVGNNGSLADIESDLAVGGFNASGSTQVDIDDHNRAGTRTATLDTYVFGSSNYTRLRDLAGGTIYAQSPNTSLVTLRTGTGPVTVAVLGTPIPTNVAGNGPLTVNVGNAGSLQAVRSPLTISDPAGRLATLNINDQNDSADHNNITLDTINQGGDFLRLQNLAPATIYAVSAQTSALVINGGSGTNLWSIEGTAAGVNTAIYGGAGYNQFGAGDANSDALFGPLALHGRPDSALSFMEYLDWASPTAQTYTLTANTISRPGLAPVTYDNLVEMIFVPARVGGNTINVASVADGVTAALQTADGDTVTIGTNGTLAAIRGAVAVSPLNDNTSATVVIDDSADPTPPAGPITLSYNASNSSYEISGLTSNGMFLGAGQNTTFTTSLLLGAGDKIVNVQDAPQAVALGLNAGRGTNTLDYTNYPDNVLVNLQTGAATGFSSIANIQNVTGASGGAPGSYNILVGNGGNVLIGGSGRRNLLIAGASASTLIGGNDDDILIGGTTAYDQEADMASLVTIMNYWSGTGDDYFTRVGNLTTGNGVPLLDASTVVNNGGGNTVLGNAGGAAEMNLFYGLDPSQESTDYNPDIGEVFINV